MQDAYDPLRPLAEFLPEGRAWAAENGFAGALDETRYRHVADAARDQIIPSERRNNKLYFRSSLIPEMVRGLAANRGRPYRSTSQLAPAA